MKYIDADKLIAEIEKRMNILDLDSPFGIGGRVELELVLDTISSLQQVQSEEVDLEKDIEAYFKGWHIEEEIGMTKPDGWSVIVDDLKDVARHFAEWGAIHLNTKKEEGK